MNSLVFLAGATEGVNPVKSVGNIFFYVLLALLVVAVVTICLIFTKSKTFKIHLREKIKNNSDVYKVPKLVKIYDDEVKEEIQYTIEQDIKEQEEYQRKTQDGEIKKESHIIDFKFADEKDNKKSEEEPKEE